MIAFVPARRDSKGVPMKNRKLLRNTMDVLVGMKEFDRIVVSTDDKEIIKVLKSEYSSSVEILHRPDKLGGDTICMRDVVSHAIDKLNIDDEDIMVLYLTYPLRERRHIRHILKYWKKSGADSMVGMKKIKTHPYMCFHVNRGVISSFFSHDLYRRQDYPEAWELTHFACVLNTGSIDYLNTQLMNEYTVPYFIKDESALLNIDVKSDMDVFGRYEEI